MSRMNGVKAASMGLMVATVMGALAGAAKADVLVTLEKGQYGPYSGQLVMVANSASDWNSMMRKLERDNMLSVVPGPDAPAGVDWNNEVVVLVAAGATAYDVQMTLTPHGNGVEDLGALYTPGDGSGESLPYHLAKLGKHPWLQTQLWEGSAAGSVLPMSGSDNPTPVRSMSWGALKADYR